MSTDTEANHHKRIQALEKGLTRLNDLSPEIESRLNWLEHPPEQVVENTKTRGLLTCPECGGTAIKSKGCTAILWDRGIQHHCQRCEHSWRVNIKDWYKRDMEKRRGEVSRDERIKKILDVLQGKVLDAIEEGLECECPLHVAAYSSKNHNATCPYGRAVDAFNAFRESLEGGDKDDNSS